MNHVTTRSRLTPAGSYSLVAGVSANASAPAESFSSQVSSCS